jgi:hypothetical protein
MTLILTAVHRHGVTQVVDRLVTRRANGAAQQFDPRANKTVLFSARDAFVTLAYTGLAYIDGLPTDQWIAETLRDKPVALGRDGRRPAMLCFERVANWPSIGQALLRLASRLEATMSRLTPAVWRSAPITIVVAGWQQYRTKRPRAFGLTIAKPKGRLTEVLRFPRHLGRGFGLITEPDGHLSAEEQRAALDAVRQVTPVDAERAMVAEIRKVAARTDVVGPHCMCILLPPPWVGWARIRYDSPSADMVHLISERATLQIPVAFSPWVVTEGWTMAPSINSGGNTETQVGEWLLQIEGTGERRDPRAPLGLQFTQDRPPQRK